jgi:hypothetical protein
MKLSRLFRTPVAVIAAAVILSGSVFAFAASNTVNVTSAGDGQSTISGFTTNDIRYGLNDTDPTLLKDMSFQLIPVSIAGTPQPAAGQVKVKIGNGTGAAWEPAVVVGTPDANNVTTWHYQPTVTVNVTDMANLHVVAVSGSATPIPAP